MTETLFGQISSEQTEIPIGKRTTPWKGALGALYIQVFYSLKRRVPARIKCDGI